MIRMIYLVVESVILLVKNIEPVFGSRMVKHSAKLQTKIYSLAFFSVVNLIKNMMLMAGLSIQKILL